MVDRSPFTILRNGVRINTADAAELLGLTTQSIRNLASGKVALKGPTQRLAATLGLSFSSEANPASGGDAVTVASPPVLV
jgi:DNA-binding XRE family transcriptional regulator